MRSYQTKNVSIRLCDEFNNEKRQRIGVLADTYCILANNLILARTIWKTAARERRMLLYVRISNAKYDT